MKVEVLYFEGCPNHAAAVEMVRRVLERERIEAETYTVEGKTVGVPQEKWLVEALRGRNGSKRS